MSFMSKLSSKAKAQKKLSAQLEKPSSRASLDTIDLQLEDSNYQVADIRELVALDNKEDDLRNLGFIMSQFMIIARISVPGVGMFDRIAKGRDKISIKDVDKNFHFYLSSYGKTFKMRAKKLDKAESFLDATHKLYPEDLDVGVDIALFYKTSGYQEDYRIGIPDTEETYPASITFYVGKEKEYVSAEETIELF